MSSHTLVQAMTHLNAGRWAAARLALQAVLQVQPRNAEALAAMAVACQSDGLPDDARDYLDRAHHEAVRRPPSDPAAAVRVAMIMDAASRPAAAAEILRPAAKRWPAQAGVLGALGVALHKIGRVEEGVQLLRRALQLRPDSLEAAGALAMMLTYAPDTTPQEQREACEHFGRLLTKGVQVLPPPPPRSPGPIRVGLVSADLRAHAVAFFARAILEHLDRGRFTVAVYSSVHKPDAVTESLRARADLWRDIAATGDVPAAELMRADAMDVLIDLSGLSGGHRLAVLARRPAPVQLTMIGFPATTGVPGITHRLVSTPTDGAGDEAFSTEALIRLDPCFLCYSPPADPPPVRPRDPAAPPTFAAFVTLTKLNEPTLRRWAAVLRAVPGSRLRLRHFALAEASVRNDLAARFAALGIGPERLSIEPPAPDVASTLALYDDVDVALDTYPFSSATTMCHSLLMGVPVVTLPGQTHASRVGRAILTAAGLPELCASTEEEYVRLAAELVRDAPRLAELRRGLRARLLASPVCDGPVYAARLGDAIEAAVRAAHREPAPPPPAAAGR